MKFTIDYAKWRCGFNGPNRIGEGETALLNPEGFQCCLGQIELQLGLTSKDLFGNYFPGETGFLNILAIRSWTGVCLNSDLANKAMHINDDEDTTPSEKRVALTALFSEHGHELEFVNVPETTDN